MTHKTTTKRTTRPTATRPVLTPRDYDNDETYQRPRAWGIAKRAFGDGYLLRELMLRLEDLCIQDARECPRRHLSAAIWDYLRKTERERIDVDLAWQEWLFGNSLTPAEYREARDALRQIVAQPDVPAGTGTDDQDFRAAA
jgi:hypothetical protein